VVLTTGAAQSNHYALTAITAAMHVFQVWCGVAGHRILREFGLAGRDQVRVDAAQWMSAAVSRPASRNAGTSSTPSKPLPSPCRRTTCSAGASAITWPRSVKSLRLFQDRHDLYAVHRCDPVGSAW
jgi:hypothetical protein